MNKISPKSVIERYRKARDRRRPWEAHWQECYDYALPHRGSIVHTSTPGEKRTDRLFDGTAPDAVDQLAASLLSQLTPPWTRWFSLNTGSDVSGEEEGIIRPLLDDAAERLQSHFDRSNFAIEVHQCYLDLVTAGTACLLFEQAPPGEPSAFRFTAVPLSQAAFEEDAFGRLESTYRCSELTLSQLQSRFPKAQISKETKARAEKDPGFQIEVIEGVIPDENGYTYIAARESELGAAGEPVALAQGRFTHSPFINFRWLKAPGETYGRSPVMKTLPDIKTANKVVELVLKNATIAVTGVWQADDDGVLNPATVKLTPGTVIPKAVGSAGLTPLQAPGKFDVSQLILDELRARIRHSLLADKLGQVNAPRMTATEVIERGAEMARLLGATYGRLQSELLTPLVRRALSILARRGEIQDIRLDGRMVDLEYRSPLARQQTMKEAQNALQWLEALNVLGPQATAIVDPVAAARWLARVYGVPSELIAELPLQAPNSLESIIDTVPPEALSFLENVVEMVGQGVPSSKTPAPVSEEASYE